MSGPRTVLYVHSSAEAYGSDRQLRLIVGGLDPRRYRPLVVLPYEGKLGPVLRADGVEVVVRPLAVLRRGQFSPAGLARVAAALAADRRALGALARARRVALVHSNTSVVLGGAAAAAAAGVPHIWHVREIYTDVPAAALAVHRRTLGRAAALPCVSDATRTALGCRRARTLPDGLALLPEPVERAAARAELGLPADRFVVLLLGRIAPWKGQGVLARALAEPALAQRGAIGICAGAPWHGEEVLTDQLRMFAERLGLGERLRMEGYRADVSTLLGAADVVAVPSTRPDPLPNSALEGAAAGLPVVAANHGGLPEIVRDGLTGLLVPPGDHRALAAAVGALADDPDARARLGAAAAADVRARYAPERLLASVQDLYDELLRT